ncbi:MAG: hypothetical protein KAH84_04170 [Thiomargarita sp.]|nr:hypothetical protein [Thiomargarita sp.]
MNLVINIPEKYLFNQSSETLKFLLKLNTAIDMYRNGLLSSSAAAYEFLYECKKRGIECQTYENIEELDAEVAMLAKELP